MASQSIVPLFPLNSFFAFFTHDRRDVHDYLARTAVIANPDASSHDTPKPSENPPA